MPSLHPLRGLAAPMCSIPISRLRTPRPGEKEGCAQGPQGVDGRVGALSDRLARLQGEAGRGRGPGEPEPCGPGLEAGRRPGAQGPALTISTFSRVRFLIFSSILWMLCSRSSFFLFIRLFFSTRGFSWTSVSRERFSCGQTDTEGRPSETQGEAAATCGGQRPPHLA